MPAYACPTCGSINTARHCPQHTPRRAPTPDRRPTPAQRGYDHAWRRTRGRYLKHHPTCEHPECRQPATDVHHLDGKGPNSPNGHKDHNLQALCKTHHQQRTTRQQPPGTAHWRHQTNAPIIALLGPAATGKSHTAARIQQADPTWQHRTIDTYHHDGTAWPGFLHALSTSTQPTLAESIALPRSYQRFLASRGATIVAVHCTEHERQHRLAQRDTCYPSRRLYDDRSKAHFVIDTTTTTTPAQHDHAAAALDTLVHHAATLGTRYRGGV